MSFPRFEFRKTEIPPAKMATDQARKTQSVAGVAGALPKNAPFASLNARAEIDLSAFAERAAIMERDGGMSRAEADEAAAWELGHSSAGALYRAVIEAWGTEIEVAPSKLHGFDKLAAVSNKFLTSGWSLKALAAGWCGVSLFGVHAGPAPKQRGDAYGLVPSLAWGVLQCSIVGFSRDACTLRAPRGSEPLRQPRMRMNFDQGVAWWQHPTLSHGERS